MRRGKSHWAAADYGNLEGQPAPRPPRIHIDGMLRFRPVPLGQKTLERPDCDRAINFSTTAGTFTRMSTNPAADASQWVRVAGKLVRLFKSPFSNERNVPARVGMGWTCHHAGEIGIQPIPVNFLVFEPFQQDGNLQCVFFTEHFFNEGQRTVAPARPFAICST